MKYPNETRYLNSVYAAGSWEGLPALRLQPVPPGVASMDRAKVGTPCPRLGFAQSCSQWAIACWPEPGLTRPLRGCVALPL